MPRVKGSMRLLSMFTLALQVNILLSGTERTNTQTEPGSYGTSEYVLGFPHSTSSSPSKKLRAGFVTAKSGRLYLNQERFDFRGFNAPTLFSGTAFEDLDALRSIAGFATPVTRSYTLRVANEAFGLSTKYSDAHIVGWNNTTNDWIYNELNFQRLDKMLALAADEGVKIILPIINQDYGDSSTDYVGNFNDLIRHRFNTSDYATAQRIDWFTNTTICDDFKKIISRLINRQNSQNGRFYGRDDTILAYETGNEMNWAELTLENSTGDDSAEAKASFKLTHVRPAPAEWTINIAKHIKSLAPDTLVMDGSFARNSDVTQAWPIQSLQSPYVDLFSYHLYGDGDSMRASLYQAQVEKYDKTFIVGEHGFYSSPEVYNSFYQNFRGAGALLWSLRPHSEVSGFVTHGEGNNIFSYHVPGWKTSTDKEFDQLEFEIVRGAYSASFEILDRAVPAYPIPQAPYPFFVTNGTHIGISFKGAAWAEQYEVWRLSSGSHSSTKVLGGILDNKKEGTLFISIDPGQSDNPTLPPDSSDTPGSVTSGQEGFQDSQSYDGEKTSAKTYGSVANSMSPDDAGMNINNTVSLDEAGEWYSVRGLSVDGTPGPFSQPTFIPYF